MRSMGAVYPRRGPAATHRGWRLTTSVASGFLKGDGAVAPPPVVK
jgi:hypothetical protein